MRLVTASMVVAVLALVTASGPAHATDHFTCYKTKTTSGTAKFQAVAVTLTDGFRASAATALTPRLLCAPASKNGEDPTAPAHPDHLTDYRVKPFTRFAPLSFVRADDQFGTH